MESKQCCKCKQVKSLDGFPVNNRKRDGRDTWCKPCKKKYNSSYYLETKDRFSDARMTIDVEPHECLGGSGQQPSTKRR